MKYKAKEANVIKDNSKIEIQINKLFQKTASVLMEIYILFYLCLFPLCIRDKYFDIMSFRFELFWKPTLAYGVIFLFLGLLYLMCDALYNKGSIRRRFYISLKEEWLSSNRDIGLERNEENSSINTNYQNKGDVNRGIGKKHKLKFIGHRGDVDIALTILILLFSLSTILAEYPYEAFWGNRGRYQGLLIWLMFYVAYWLVTRFYKFNKWHLWSYMICASVVCVWGILNFFLLTFGMFDNANESYKYIFVSSIGNINTYTNFTGILFGIASTLFISSEKNVEWIFYYAVLIITSFAQIMGLSDNAILSTGIVLIVSPLILWKDYGTIARYFFVVATYLSAMKITSLITISGIETMNDPDPSIQINMAGKGLFTIVLSVVLLATVVIGINALKERKLKEIEWSKVSEKIRLYKRIWCILLIFGVMSVLTILILSNNGIYNELWKPYRKLLIFNDSWGTGRGLCWRLGMEYWKNDSTFLAKLFGYGPDTFYIITMDRFMNIMQDAGYGMFDSAHNEYFEYFITVGICGLAAYLSVLYCSLRKMFCSFNVYSKVIGIGILAYAFQAVVNIAVPITTPVFMILMFVGLVTCKETQKI